MALYPLFIAVFVVVPTLAPHRSMKNARTAALNRLGAQIRELLEDDRNATEQATALKALVHRYELIDNNSSTWPFRTASLRAFFVVALAPLLPPLLTVLLGLLVRRI